MKATPQVAAGYAAFERRQDLIDHARRVGMKFHTEAAQAMREFMSDEAIKGRKLIFRFIAESSDGRRICISEHDDLEEAVNVATKPGWKAPAIGVQFQWNHSHYGYDLRTEVDQILFF